MTNFIIIITFSNAFLMRKEQPSMLRVLHICSRCPVGEVL